MSGSARSTGGWCATAAASTTAARPEALHDLRKRGKELRYLLELFGSPFPTNVVKPMVSTLKDLQEVLGRFQDRAVQIEHAARDARRARRRARRPGAR